MATGTVNMTIPASHRIKGIEIGVWEGATSVKLMSRYPLLELTGIDPFDGYQDWWGFIDADSMHAREEIARRVTEPFRDRFQLLTMRSDEAVSVLADGDFDFVYIDGDHSFQWALHDIMNYWAKVKPGGMLCGHDRSLSSVWRAVIQFTTENELPVYQTEEPQSDSWFIPKPYEEIKS